MAKLLAGLKARYNPDEMESTTKRGAKLGAHHMLQIRTRTLDGSLRKKFE